MTTFAHRSRSARDPRMARGDARRPRRRRARRARELIARLVDEAQRSGAHVSLGPADAVRQHDSGRPAAGDAGRPRARSAAAPLRSLERARDGRAREQGQLRARRSRRELRVGGDALRRRLQPLLPRAERDVRRRPRLLPGTLVARRVRARLSRRAHHRRAARALSPGGRRARASRRIRIRG